MLRVSANVTESNIDIQMINGESPQMSSDIEFGEVLMSFASSLASRDEILLSEARSQLLSIAGADVLVDAAGVAANFQRMVRIADAIGIPVDSDSNEISNDVRKDLELYKFDSAKNSTTQH